jgi:hypothetical protein
MKPPLAFISYDFKLGEDARSRFIDEIASCPEPFNVDNWSVERGSPREDWDKLVHSRIGRCDFMIVLVTRGMDPAAVGGEILEAKRCNVPFFGVYLDKTRTRVQLPDGLAANRVIAYDWDRIAAAIRQLMKEGKHHVFA